MALEKRAVEKINNVGGKAVWEVKLDELIDIDGSKYVWVPRQNLNNAFTRMCVEVDGKIPEDMSRDFSLTESRGYKHLLELRERAQRADSADQANIPSMFKRKSVVSAKRPKRTKDEVCDMRLQPKTVAITIPEAGEYAEAQVLVKCSVTSDENLVVPYDLEVIGHVIAFIRREGYDVRLKRNSALPKGIWAVNDGTKYKFMYSFTSEAGVISRHKTATLEDAVHGSQHGPPRKTTSNEEDDEDDNDDGQPEEPQ